MPHSGFGDTWVLCNFTQNLNYIQKVSTMSYTSKNLLPRHMKVMDLKIAGFNQKEIAKELEMTPTKEIQRGRQKYVVLQWSRVALTSTSGPVSD